jgi:hypothetical protein
MENERHEGYDGRSNRETHFRITAQIDSTTDIISLESARFDDSTETMTFGTISRVLLSKTRISEGFQICQIMGSNLVCLKQKTLEKSREWQNWVKVESLTRALSSTLLLQVYKRGHFVARVG